MFLRGRTTSDLVLGLGFGVAAGCLMGVLYAPQAGRRTRRQVVFAMEDASKCIRQITSRLNTGADELLDRCKAAIEKGKGKIESAMDAGPDLLRGAWRELRR